MEDISYLFGSVAFQKKTGHLHFPGRKARKKIVVTFFFIDLREKLGPDDFRAHIKVMANKLLQGKNDLRLAALLTQKTIGAYTDQQFSVSNFIKRAIRHNIQVRVVFPDSGKFFRHIAGIKLEVQ